MCIVFLALWFIDNHKRVLSLFIVLDTITDKFLVAIYYEMITSGVTFKSVFTFWENKYIQDFKMTFSKTNVNLIFEPTCITFMLS